jgi:hypothetical protein
LGSCSFSLVQLKYYWMKWLDAELVTIYFDGFSPRRALRSHTCVRLVQKPFEIAIAEVKITVICDRSDVWRVT